VRIEEARAVVFLKELPSGWAQMCITSPPPSCAEGEALAVLAEVHRVLRPDGTLWLITESGERLEGGLHACGFELQPSPAWASARLLEGEPRVRLALLSKGPRYYLDARGGFPASTPSTRTRPPASAQLGRAECRGLDRAQRRKLIRRCILAGSSRVACGACGAPFWRAQPTCAHHDPGGSCLVLDPFYSERSVASAEIARRHGRSFLGVSAAASPTEAR
jgi:hypothetical protein